jgi:Fic family protein
VSGPPLVRLVTSPALKERRLAALLAGRDPREPWLRAAVQDAQVTGSLELAGLATTPDEVRAARAGHEAPVAVAGLIRALDAVEPSEPVTVAALQAWHAAALSGGGALRVVERQRPDGPPPAPAPFVEGRLRILEQWLGTDGGTELKAPQQGALVMARVVEILPFEDGNGRVARLAASHVMVRAGAQPPVLTGSDAERLREALAAAFALHTEPLCALLDEASGRALDVMIRTLEAGG